MGDVGTKYSKENEFETKHIVWLSGFYSLVEFLLMCDTTVMIMYNTTYCIPSLFQTQVITGQLDQARNQLIITKTPATCKSCQFSR